MPVLPKFEFEIDRNGCWVCTNKHINRDGYPECKLNGLTVSVARYIYSQLHGDIKDGLHVLHGCANRACINPAHLRLGTHQENMDDRTLHGNTAPLSALTTIQVKEIKDLISATSLRNIEIAELYSVAPGVISRIRRGVTYKHVEPVI